MQAHFFSRRDFLLAGAALDAMRKALFTIVQQVVR